MPNNPVSPPLPADLPTNWVYGQTVGPNGTDVGLTQQHGYNYLGKQVNAAQAAINNLGGALADLNASDVGAIPDSEKGKANGVAELDSSGKVPAAQLPDMDYLPLSGGTMQGRVDFSGNFLENPTLNGAIRVNNQPGTSVFMGANRIQAIGEPQDNMDAATKGYVDNKIRYSSVDPGEGSSLVTGSLLVIYE